METLHGIIIINWKPGMDRSKIQPVINSFYNDSTTTIEGIAYYETENKALANGIDAICNDKLPLNIDPSLVLGICKDIIQNYNESHSRTAGHIHPGKLQEAVGKALNKQVNKKE